MVRSEFKSRGEAMASSKKEVVKTVLLLNHSEMALGIGWIHSPKICGQGAGFYIILALVHRG